MPKRLNDGERVALVYLFSTAALTAMHNHLPALERRGYVTRGADRIEEHEGDAETGDGYFVLKYPQYEITVAGRKAVMHWRQMRRRAWFVAELIDRPTSEPLWP